jgi:hypothetical protein
MKLFGTAAMVAMAGLLAAGCASSPSGDPETQSWRMVLQQAKRFAVFVNDPGAPKAGDLVTFKLAYVYMPGEVKHEEKEVGWQEYHAVTVNCADNTVKLGPRSRYAPDGSVIVSDDNQKFEPINWGTALDDAARGKCKNDYWAGNVTFKANGGWMGAARKHIAANEAPVRPIS